MLYNGNMNKPTPNIQRLREAQHLQALEHNPLSVDQIAMFAMFDREGWREDERLAYIKKRAKQAAMAHAVE